MSNSVFGWSETYAPSEKRIWARPSAPLAILSPLPTSAPFRRACALPLASVTTTLPIAKSTRPVLASAASESAAETSASMTPRGLSLKRFASMFFMFPPSFRPASSLPKVPAGKELFTLESSAHHRRNHGPVVLVQIDVRLIVRVRDLRNHKPLWTERVVDAQAQVGLLVAARDEEERIVRPVDAALVAHQAEQHRSVGDRCLSAEAHAHRLVPEVLEVGILVLLVASVEAAECHRLARRVPAVSERDAADRAPRVAGGPRRVTEVRGLREDRHLAVFAVVVLPLRHCAVGSAEVVVVDLEVLALIAHRDRFLVARPAQPEVAVDRGGVEVAVLPVEFPVRRDACEDRPFRRKPVHVVESAAGRGEVVGLLHAAGGEGRHDPAQGRDRDLVGRRSAVDIAVVAEPEFHEAAEPGGAGFQRRKIPVDGLLDGLGRVARTNVLELALGVLLLAHLEIGAGDLGARLGVIGIDGERSFERKDRALAMPGVESGDAQQIVEIDLAGAFRLQRLEQLIGGLRIVLLHEPPG